MTRPTPSTQLIDRLLEVIESDILPMTKNGVAMGNKVFGAALLHKSDFSLLLAETNNELESPLHHGEMHALKRYHEINPAQRPDPASLIFLSTHEPCSLCLSAITWAGFDNFFYFFSHEDSRDAFDIPHDLKILKEVFGLDAGQYQRSNAFWDSYDICAAINAFTDDQKKTALPRIDKIRAQYAALSDDYQGGKADNAIPLN